MPARTFIIGDVHGCRAQLDTLLQSIAPTADDHLVFLGDLIDRGPDSAGVVKLVLQLSTRHKVTTIMGNHEQMLLAARAAQDPDAPRDQQGYLYDKLADWLKNGGDETLRSYAGVRATLRDIPPDHWTFLQTRLVDYLETETHLFVHANCYPDMPMADQPDFMLRWERCDSICPHDSGKTIVCGHTPQKSGRPMNRGFAICLDTNACRGGNLSCLEASSGRLWQADAQCKVSRFHISDFSEE